MMDRNRMGYMAMPPQKTIEMIEMARDKCMAMYPAISIQMIGKTWNIWPCLKRKYIDDMNGMEYMAMPLKRIEMIGRNNMGYMAMPQQTNKQTHKQLIL